MRKSILFIAAGILALGANAKDVHKNAQLSKARANVSRNNVADVRITPVNGNNHQAKGTAAAFHSEHFDTGLPANWAVGSTTGNGTWKWFPNGQQSGSAFHIGAIATTTGFMIYDSDSIGTASPGLNPVGWMSNGTAPFNCTGHTTVALNFNEYFRSFNDSCFVDVSTSPTFATSTRFAVSPNNSLNGNDFVATNPYNCFINITSVAANQAAVYIRFFYFGPVDGGYSWQVDDMTLSELDPVNVALHGSFLFNDTIGAYNSSIGNVASTFRDTIAPITMLNNIGANAQSGFTVNAKIFKNNVQVYNQTKTVTALPISAVDSIVEFPKYLPDAVAPGGSPDSYFAAFSSSVTGNANTTQLVDTVRFTVTDTLWSQFTNTSAGSFFIHKPASQGETSAYLGARFDVPPGATDTITGISVAFGSGTTAGTMVQVQVYKLDNPSSNGWLPQYSTFVQALGAGEISTTTSVIFKYFPMQLDAAYPILSEGTWAAVVTPVNAPTSSTVTVISSTPNPATGFAGFFGQSDTSGNAGNFTFGFQSEATGVTSIPLVRLHFATNHAVLNTANLVSNLNIGQVYPNPANNEVNIPFATTTDANVNVSIMNTVGQVVKSQSLGRVNAGTSKIATFSTSDMASGVYFYSIEVNGARTTNRFVVSH